MHLTDLWQKEKSISYELVAPLTKYSEMATGKALGKGMFGESVFNFFLFDEFCLSSFSL